MCEQQAPHTTQDVAEGYLNIEQIDNVQLPESSFLMRSDTRLLYFNPLSLPDWADAIGQDQYGLWTEIVLELEPKQAGDAERVIRQRLRWIPPGRFLMGSPDDEIDRQDDETQHPVILTEGFWLFDTTVTQELWQAVMDNNPSHFKGDNRPVEQVSWDQAQEFIRTFNKTLQHAELQLPTEAQWEYACRAGTQTPFHVGDNITPEQVNYNGNHFYADGEKGKYREETVPVKALPCNAWGLYQMHGNVYEWCEDWFGAYPTEPQTNPTRTTESGSQVLRGGSWINNARYVRSAYRGHGVPTARLYGIGFRCALVQGEHPP
ncbi:MAG: formylglycine-generating enzyme family protein, partial [Myxococcota bacterium]